jgi:hypothetical protein
VGEQKSATGLSDPPFYNNAVHPVVCFTHMWKALSAKETIQRFFKYIYYVKTKTILYYHLRQCLREARLSSQNKQ